MQLQAFEDESFLYKVELQVKQLFSSDSLQVKLNIIKIINITNFNNKVNTFNYFLYFNI